MTTIRTIMAYSGYGNIEVTQDEWVLAIRRAKLEAGFHVADAELNMATGPNLFRYLSLVEEGRRQVADDQRVTDGQLNK